MTLSRTPLLAVAHRPRGLSVLSLRAAAAGLCDLLWLVDLSRPEAAEVGRLLQRTGTIVDLTGVAPERWAEHVAPHRPDGLATFSDEDLVELAGMAESLGLRFSTPAAIAGLLDKVRQRGSFRDAGLASIGVWDLEVGAREADIDVVAAAVSYPVVAKPRYGNDSRLVQRIDDAGDLRRVLGPDSEAPVGMPMIVEEYLADTDPVLGDGIANYLSVESVISGGRPRHFAITGRLPPAPPFRETGFFLPSTVAGAERDAVLDLATRAIIALDITWGCAHTEIKFTPEGPRIIEVNGRLGGGIPLMYQLSTGRSAVRMAMEVALDLDPDVALDHAGVDGPSTGFRFLFHAPIGAVRVEAIDGLATVGAWPEVEAVTLHRAPGTEVDWRIGNHDYVYSVAGAVPDAAAAVELWSRVERTVSVRYAS